MIMNKCPNGGKVCYNSEDQAKEARKTLKYKGRTPMGKAKVYQCTNCWKYHLTTTGY